MVFSGAQWRAAFFVSGIKCIFAIKTRPMIRKFTLLLALLLPAFGASAQFLDLPRYELSEEKALLNNFLNNGEALPSGILTPPVLPVRTMAEWEEVQAIVITWNTSSTGIRTILAEIVRHARLECRVIVACSSQTIVNSARNFLISKNVDLSSNVEFVIGPNDSIWVRDFGPNCVYANDVDSLYFVDWIYNRPQRPNDDTLSTTLAPYFGIPLYRTLSGPDDMVHTGGNFMSDGMGTAFSSRLILEENEPNNPYGVSVKNELQINQIMQDYMGIERYIKMEALPHDLIHHIDMHMKLLDEETLLVGQYPEGIADGPQIEANIQYVLNNFSTSFGAPYDVKRIVMPPDGQDLYPDQDGDYRTYANALFVNKTVLVPFYEQQYDTTAQRIWEAAMPGYKIVGINCNSIIPLSGAIHCITKEIGVPDPLRIVHQRLKTQNNALVSEYKIDALIQHRSGIASAQLYWALSPNGPWSSLPMSLTNSASDTWSCAIPLQAPDLLVYYYIDATANNGKSLTRPLPGAAGPWSFRTVLAVSDNEPLNVQTQPVFPNPARAITCIPVSLQRGGTLQINLYNSLGQWVQRVYQGEAPAGDNKYFFDASLFPPGTYWLEVRSSGSIATQKVLVR